MNTVLTVLKHLIPALQVIQQELQREGKETVTPAAAKAERPIQTVLERRKAMLTVSEASEFLSISRSWIYKMVSLGDMPHYKLGSRVLFSEAKLLEWLEGTSGSR